MIMRNRKYLLGVGLGVVWALGLAVLARATTPTTATAAKLPEFCPNITCQTIDFCPWSPGKWCELTGGVGGQCRGDNCAAS